MDCPHIPELGYGDFSQRLHQAAHTQRLPLVGSMELNFRCNLRCQHCYVAHGHNGLPGQQELNLAEIQRIFTEITQAGTLWFLLTGGEPLVRRDFPDIYLAAKRSGLITTLFTNGTLLTPRLADLLAEYPPFAVEITLYGYTQETYERVTAIPGSYARCRRGIDLLLERRLPLRLKTIVMRLNQHELADMQAFASRLGVPFRFDPILNAGFKDCGRARQLRLSPQEIVALDLADEQRMQGWQQFSQRYLQAPRLDAGRLYACGAGVNTYHIDPYGQLSLCMLARQQSFDLRQGSFEQGWQFLAGVRSQPSVGRYECGDCRLRPLCGQCPGWAALENGDPQQRVDYLCQIAHQRARAFDFVQLEAAL